MGSLGSSAKPSTVERGKLPCFCPVQAHSHVGPKKAGLKAVVIGCMLFVRIFAGPLRISIGNVSHRMAYLR